MSWLRSWCVRCLENLTLARVTMEARQATCLSEAASSKQQWEGGRSGERRPFLRAFAPLAFKEHCGFCQFATLYLYFFNYMFTVYVP